MDKINKNLLSLLIIVLYFVALITAIVATSSGAPLWSLLLFGYVINNKRIDIFDIYDKIKNKLDD